MINRTVHKSLLKIGAFGLVISLLFPATIQWHHFFCAHEHHAHNDDGHDHMDDEDELCQLCDYQIILEAVIASHETTEEYAPDYRYYNEHYRSVISSTNKLGKQLRAPPVLV